MLLAKDIAAARTAIEICNNPELKREILCAPGSVYDINKGSSEHDNKKQWNEIIEKKVAVKLQNLGLAKQLQEKVIGIVLTVGVRMLSWAEYHEGTLGLSREYSVSFLNNSFFTQHGIIDNKKAAEELIKDKSLKIKQRYKLACLYCFTDLIPALYWQVNKREFYYPFFPHRIKQPKLVKFWSYYLMGDIDSLKGERKLNRFRLEKAIECGSKAAVEYCLEKTKVRRKEDAIVDAALAAVRCRLRVGPFAGKDWIIFRNQRYNDSEESWVPSDYYVDIVCFLLLKMREDQQIQFLKKDIEGPGYKREDYEYNHSRVLRFFLNWPYQSYFLKTVKLMWEFLPKRDYAVLLLRISDKIEHKNEGNLNYGEERSYDYRALLKEFWSLSPEHYRRYVFSDWEAYYYTNDRMVRTTTGIGLLINLFTLKSFTYEDIENIKMILASANSKEKESILYSMRWRDVCIGLMKEEKWETLNGFLSTFSLPKEEENKFKRELSFTLKAQCVCIDFVKNDEWNAVESLIKWSSLPEKEISNLKKEMSYSEVGKSACVELLSRDKKVEAVDKFIRWCFSFEEDVKAFKKELVFSDQGTGKCANLVKADQLELVSEFINFCLSSEEEIRELKKNVAYRFGSPICKTLISDNEVEKIYNAQGRKVIRKKIKFKGGKWEEVEKFLTWCFSSEEEISNFKKDRLLEISGKEIHFNLIKSNQWEEAETFFAWLGLSCEEIKTLKKETLIDCEAANEMFMDLMCSGYDEKKFVDYGTSPDEAIHLFLRWYLTDKRAVFEFYDEVRSNYGEYGGLCNEDHDMLEEFAFTMDKHLRELEEEKRGVKRKSETFSPNKKFCSSNLENGGEEEEFESISELFDRERDDFLNEL